MTRSAIASLSYASAALVLAVVPAAPAAAQRSVTDETVTVLDVAKTPLDDLNLTRDPIPPTLQRALREPYRDPGLNHCADIRNEIGDLDAVLGEDMDTLPNTGEHRTNIGRVAQRLVGSLIPFRGVIRSLSGANEHEREFKEAIAAGLMRRAYLKGMGQAMNCPYPARPATPEMIAAQILKREETARQEETQGRPVDVEGDSYVSEPVVQPTP
jgi:hypothetical protein